MDTNTQSADNAAEAAELERDTVSTTTEADTAGATDEADDDGNEQPGAPDEDDDGSDAFFTFADLPDDYDDAADATDQLTEDAEDDDTDSNSFTDDDADEVQAADTAPETDETAENAAQDAAQDAEEAGTGTNTPEGETAAAEQPDAAQPAENSGDGAAPDYAVWESEDIAAIVAEHPELQGKRLRDIVTDPRRFAELRGDPTLRGRLSAVEALTLAGGVKGGQTPAGSTNAAQEQATGTVRDAVRETGKAHLRPAPGKAAQQAVAVPREIKRMRDEGIFGANISDAELLELYRNVSHE